MWSTQSSSNSSSSSSIRKNLPTYKVVLLGDSAVGKSSLALRFVRGEYLEYRESTIGAAFLNKTLEKPNVKLDIWDTAGQERYHSLAPMYYRGASGAIVVYDITNRTSFDRAKYWVKTLKDRQPDTVIALVGNKVDLVADKKNETVTVNEEEARAYASQSGLLFFQTSAKANHNVNLVFETLASKIPESAPKPPAPSVVVDPEVVEAPRPKGCC